MTQPPITPTLPVFPANTKPDFKGWNYFPSYEFIHGQLEPSQLLPGKTNDQSLAVQTARGLQPGQLQLQDKGFFDGQSWREVQAAGAFLVMPWTRSVTVWLPGEPHEPETRLDVAAGLAATTQNQVSWPQILLGRGKNHRYMGHPAFRSFPE